jgi:hypothetical protein
MVRSHIASASRDAAIKQIERSRRTVEIRFPHNGGQFVVTVHHFQNGRDVNCRLTTDPLDIACALRFAPGDRGHKEIAGQQTAPRRVKRICFGDAEGATQVAPRKIEQVRRNQFRFFTTFNALPKDSSLGSSFARAAFASQTTGTTAVFTKRAVPQLLSRAARADPMCSDCGPYYEANAWRTRAVEACVVPQNNQFTGENIDSTGRHKLSAR